MAGGGWTGYGADARTMTRGTGGRDEVIPLTEEQLKVGKRDVSHGRVRVRSYVVEEPVEEQVNLRQEHVHVERRPVDRPATELKPNLRSAPSRPKKAPKRRSLARGHVCGRKWWSIRMSGSAPKRFPTRCGGPRSRSRTSVEHPLAQREGKPR